MRDDVTAVSTAHTGGVICLIELHSSRLLQWCVCLLHANELPLSQLFKDLVEQLEVLPVFHEQLVKLSLLRKHT